MSLYVKHTENRRTYFLVPLPKKFDGRTAFLDLTERARNAINRDRRRFYDAEDGPDFWIEIQHATEYAGYVSEHANEKNIHKFGTRTGYSFFINPLDDEDKVEREQRRPYRK